MYHMSIIPDMGYKDLSPVQFGYEDCAPSHFFGPAVRTHWLIHYVVSGSGIFRIGDKEYTVGKDDFFVIPPYVETYYQANENNPWNYIWVGFTASDALPAPLPDVMHCPEARSIFTAMKDCEKHEASRSAFLTAKLWEFFTLLLRTSEQPGGYVEAALTCIHSEYMNGITVEEIAQRLNLDRTYFSTLFKKQVGVSPKQYLLAYRMQLAAKLMCENQSSVTVAAYSVGYSDIFTFSKMFKQHHGMTPSEYIKKSKEAGQ